MEFAVTVVIGRTTHLLRLVEAVLLVVDAASVAIFVAWVGGGDGPRIMVIGSWSPIVPGPRSSSGRGRSSPRVTTAAPTPLR